MLLRCTCVLCAALLAICAGASTHTLTVHRRSAGLVNGSQPCRRSKLRLEASLGHGGQGLFNQHLSLLSFLTIAIAAGADEVLVSGSKSRDRWAKDAAWIDSNFTDVWDVAAIEGFLADRDIAFLSDEQPQSSNAWILDEVDLQPHRDPADSADTIRKHVLKQVKEKGGLPRSSRRNASAVTLQVPVRGLLLSTLSERSHLHSDVARNVPFSARLRGLASKAVSRLLELTGAAAFNGVHLRIEGDSPNQDFMEGRQPMLQAYLEAFQTIGLDSLLPLYISSGVFEAEPTFAATWQNNASSLNSHKELLLAEADLAQLHSEQKAAVDFLVLVRATKFVGWAGSSFSFWAAEHRRMLGLPDNSTLLIRREKAGAGIHDLFVLSNTVIGIFWCRTIPFV